jgi:hypothetical protein
LDFKKLRRRSFSSKNIVGTIESKNNYKNSSKKSYPTNYFFCIHYSILSKSTKIKSAQKWALLTFPAPTHINELRAERQGFIFVLRLPIAGF